MARATLKGIASKLALVLFVAGLAYYFNKTGLLHRILERIESAGAWAPAVFVAVFALTAVFFVPSLVFTFSSGLLFGLAMGTALSVLGNALGATAALLLGRYIARGVTEKKFAGNPNFKVVDTALRKRGRNFVFLCRLSPIFPFSVANYAFGLTSISAKDYFLASAAGTIPSAFVYTYLGTVTGSLAAMGSPTRAKTPVEWTLLVIGLIATLALSLFIKRLAKGAITGDLESESPRS